MAFAKNGNPENPEMPNWPACTPVEEIRDIGAMPGCPAAVKIHVLIEQIGPCLIVAFASLPDIVDLRCAEEIRENRSPTVSVRRRRMFR